MIIPKHYENLKIMHENTLPPRAYYIPASGYHGHFISNRETSDRIQMLNGTWRFRYYPSIYDLQYSFLKPILTLKPMILFLFQVSGRC